MAWKYNYTAIKFGYEKLRSKLCSQLKNKGHQDTTVQNACYLLVA